MVNISGITAVQPFIPVSAIPNGEYRLAVQQSCETCAVWISMDFLLLII